MATNTSIAYYLARDPVEPGEECLSSGSEILDLVTRKVYVAGLASNVTGDGATVPQTNNQITALSARVSTLEGELTNLQAQVPDRRVATRGTQLPAGDSVQGITWSPPFETTDYEVRVTIQGPSAHPSAYYGWRLISTSKELGSCQLSFDGIPSNSHSFSAVVETLE